MRYIILGLFLIIILCLQVGFFSHLGVFSVRPDLLLIVVILWALKGGGKEGFVVGAIAGLLQDILSGPIYLHTFTKAILGLILGNMKESIAHTGAFSVVPIVFVSSILTGISDALILYFFFNKAFPATALFLIFFGEAIYNSVLVPFLIWPTDAVLARALGEGSSADEIYRMR